MSRGSTTNEERVLAFVFWHWAKPGTDRAAYAARLAEFHQALRAAPPAGFQLSVAFRAGPAPWLPVAGDTYEDWYLTDGSAALDPLDHGAVHGPCKTPHDAVAALSEGGAAGLYRLRFGVADLARVRHATWFRKPEGMSYADLDARISPLAAGAHAGVWTRQMVLGPTPEFCVTGPEPIPLDADLHGLPRSLEPVWIPG